MKTIHRLRGLQIEVHAPKGRIAKYFDAIAQWLASLVR